MKFSILALFTAATTVVSATRTFNVTEAFKPGEASKYRCLSTEKWVTKFPIPECVVGPQKYANSKDGCDYDDFVCHCINYQVFSDLIEPLVFPWEGGDCDEASLNTVRPYISDMCNYFNATLYADYAGCPFTLTSAWQASVAKTFSIISSEPIKISYKE